MPVIAKECPRFAEIQVVPRKSFRPELYARGVFILRSVEYEKRTAQGL